MLTENVCKVNEALDSFCGAKGSEADEGPPMS